MATTFPVKTALALATAIAALAVVHHFAGSGKGISPAIFPEAAHLNLIRHAPRPIPPPLPPAPVVAKTPPTPCPAGSAHPHTTRISPYFIDDCGDLDPFYAALESLEAPAKPGPPQVVTVLHYGDSPTTADLITGDVRSLLQQRFGDAGTGFLLTAKPWAWYDHRGVDLSGDNWTISTAVGKGREEVYGIGGASFEGDATANSHITLKDPAPGPNSTIEIAFYARPSGGTLAIAADKVPLESLATEAGKAAPAWHTVKLPPSTKTIDLKPTAGTVRLFGETLATGHRGILYDSLGLNGASTSVLSYGFNNAAWAAALQHTRPTLVIINYGTNESGYGAYVDKQYEPTLRTAIARIRAALPGEPILVMSPMDRGQRSGVDQIETMGTIPRIVAIQRRVAAQQNCAFFDTFDAMGGDSTMSRWYTGHPRLVAGDLIHPTPQGASIVAQLFVKDLLLGYDRYLGRKPTQPPPAKPVQQPALSTQPPTPTPAKPPITVLPKPKPSATGEPLVPPASQLPATEPEPKPEPPPQKAPEPPPA
jgi:lysophospholipase L1-like esterase